MQDCQHYLLVVPVFSKELRFVSKRKASRWNNSSYLNSLTGFCSAVGKSDVWYFWSTAKSYNKKLTSQDIRWTEAISKYVSLPPPNLNITLFYSTGYKLRLVSFMSTTEEINIQQGGCILILKKYSQYTAKIYLVHHCFWNSAGWWGDSTTGRETEVECRQRCATDGQGYFR